MKSRLPKLTPFARLVARSRMSAFAETSKALQFPKSREFEPQHFGKTSEHADPRTRVLSAWQTMTGMSSSWSSKIRTHVPSITSQSLRNFKISRVGVVTIILLLAIGATTIFIVSSMRSTTRTAVTEVDSTTATSSLNADPASTPPAYISDGRQSRGLTLVGGRPLFPLAAGVAIGEELGFQVNAPVVSRGEQVLGTVAEQGFWLGNSKDQRIFVSVPQDISANGSRSVAQLQSGEKVSVFGRLVELPYDVATIGVTGDDANQLNAQKRMVLATSVRTM